MSEVGRELVQTTKSQIEPEEVEIVQGEVVEPRSIEQGILYEEWYDRRTFTTTVKLRIRDEFRERGTGAQLRELDELLQRLRRLCA